MTKNELKASLTRANVPFKAKATLEQLQKLYNDTFGPVLEVQQGEGPVTAEDVIGAALLAPAQAVTEFDAVGEEEMRQQRINTFTVGDRDISEMACPCCGIQLDNGVTHYMDEGANGTPNTQTREWQCLGCGGEFGPEVTRTPAAKATGTGLKIEKDREEKNGIKRPSIGGKCRAIWDALDQHAETTGDDPTAKDVKALAAEHGWNPNNASIEFYQWRKFHGIAKGK